MRFKIYRENGALNSPPIFDAFEKGVKSIGHEIVNNDEDVAVIWSVLWNGRMRNNQKIYEDYRLLGKPVIIIEVGNLKRNITWRICLNHINGLGEFANNKNLDNDRPRKLGINLKPVNKNRNEKILIATQHQKSLQWNGMPTMSTWTLQTIENIRKLTDMPILVRPHPRSPLPGIDIEFPNVKLQQPLHLPGTYDDFDIDYNYHCVINHNSGPPIHAAIAGTPIICDKSSLAYPVSSTLEQILNPSLPDREEWLIKLTHTEWTLDEIKSGIPLKRLEENLKKQIKS